MSSSQDLFEKHISINPQTGQGRFSIPVGSFRADEGASAPLSVSLFCTLKTPDIKLMPSGHILEVSGKKGDEVLNMYELPIRDGRLITAKVSAGSERDFGDFTMAVGSLNGGFCDIEVRHQDGGKEKHAYSLRGGILTDYFVSTGKSLNLKWETDIYKGAAAETPGSRLLSINSGDRCLLKTEAAPQKSTAIGMGREIPVFKRLIVFPDTCEQVTYELEQKTDKGHGMSLYSPDAGPSKRSGTTTVTVTGCGIPGRKIYKIKIVDDKLSSLDITTEHTIAGAKAGDAPQVEKLTHTETVTYIGDKVSEYKVSPGAGVDPLVEKYEYTTDKTTVTCRQMKTGDEKGVVIWTREYQYKDKRQVWEKVTANGVVVIQEQEVKVDEARAVATVKTTKKIDGVTVDELILEYSPGGNLVSKTQGGIVTEWTYYNNYKKYTVVEKEVRYHNTSFFSFLLKPFDYLFPTGWGTLAFGSSGFTWGTRIETTVSMGRAANDYAKKAFNLPVDIKYPGDENGGCTHVESELVYRKVGDKKHALSLTFYGYKTLNKISSGVLVVPEVKLTVLRPGYSEVDVTALQLAVAKGAAQALLDSLKKQEGEKAKAVLADLEKSLIFQSKQNARGFKLGNVESPFRISRETLTYQADSKLPGFGLISKKETEWLTSKGEKEAGSGVTTTFSYKLNPAAPGRDAESLTEIVVQPQTRYSGPEPVKEIRTSRRSSIYTGRLHGLKNAEGVDTSYEYDRQGRLTAQKVTFADGTTTNRYHQWTALKDGLFQCETHVGGASVRVRVIKDALNRERQSWVSPDGKTWLSTTTFIYHSGGEIRGRLDYDYDSANKKCMTRETYWTEVGTDGNQKVTQILRRGDDKELDRKIQTFTVAAGSETWTRGSFQVKRQRTAQGTSETYGPSGGARSKVVRAINAAGQPTSIKYLKMDKDNKETEQDSLAFSYDDYGQLTTLTPRIGSATTCIYDASGRLLTSTTDGLTSSIAWSDRYSKTLSTGLKGEETMSLGSQVDDALGRGVVRAVWGQTRMIDDYGTPVAGTAAPTAGKTTPAGKTSGEPSPLTDYKTESTAFTRSESIVEPAGTGVSKTTFSLRGCLLEFEGLEAGVTRYTYDAFGRITSSKNNSCETTSAYADSGRLEKETITALKSKVTMTVTYTYNESGHEISRTFTCDGVDPHVIERKLLGDGRLQESTLKVKGTQKYSDGYEYDGLKRLKAWLCAGPGVENEKGQRCVKQAFVYNSVSNVQSREDGCYTGTTRPASVATTKINYTYGKKPEEMTGPDKVETKYDLFGFVLKQGKSSFAYHRNGQVDSCTIDGEDPYVFVYDDLGRVRGANQGKWSERYHYRNNRIYAVVQRDEKSTHGFKVRKLVLQNDSPSCYLQDAVVSIGTAAAATSCSFELRDAAGTVFASIDVASKKVTYFTYTPYGYRKPDPKSVTWLGFKGEPLNRLGLYYLGNYRLYDPQLQRFQSPDSWSPFGAGGLSRFNYGNADPVNNEDRDGHQVIMQYSRFGEKAWMETREFGLVLTGIGAIFAPLTSGASLAFAIAVTAISAASFYFELASIITKDSDPETSKVLGKIGLGLGLAAAAGALMGPAVSFAALGVYRTLKPVAQLSQILSRTSLTMAARYMAVQSTVIGKNALAAAKRWSRAAQAPHYLYEGAHAVSSRAHAAHLKLLNENAPKTVYKLVEIADNGLDFWSVTQASEPILDNHAISNQLAGPPDISDVTLSGNARSANPFQS
ncbi:RHS repeat domain-containing protein [Pseudomonas sp. Marseille-P9899]|uniref:RHS repeat domain-containing protein n=1 Tax=Pseudomonas sp. Marseille-P9899 TaxID=2730401 RepID=UPI00158B227E|nr:RHS repeat-associated core domain-containing protein [Pseudomonas sp. Marseille-P9899]